MKAVKVQYTVKEEYAETNKKNINQVMSDLRKLNNPGIKYSSYILNDGKTFVHLGIYSDEAAMSVATNLDSFKKFQMELKESQPEAPPKADDLNLVASAYDIF
jgi:hypothetical protein